LQETIKLTVKTTVAECAVDVKQVRKDVDDGGGSTPTTKSSITSGVNAMTFPQFLGCLEMLFEQILGCLSLSSNVYTFLSTNGIELPDLEAGGGEGGGRGGKAASTALTTASELAHRSISELLRIRKDAHSLLNLGEVKQLWDACLAFTLELEAHAQGVRAWGLRSTLLGQAKGFVERNHENHMSNLVATLDSEKWTQCNVTGARQGYLDNLCSGKAVLSKTVAKGTGGGTEGDGTVNEANIEGIKFKVVWSCLLLVEMLMSNLAAAAHFQSLASDVVGKVCELLRLFNSRTTQLVLGAGAIHSAAKLKR